MTTTDSVRVPDSWVNLVASLGEPFPLPLDASGNVCSFERLAAMYPEECARIERLDGSYGLEARVAIPKQVWDAYGKYRPSPLRRARALERHLGYPGAIFYKREDVNPTGSHKPNTALPQAYYAHRQGLSELVTDTGAGQWGAALAWACGGYGLGCTVFMTRNSYEAKPYRRYLMALAKGDVIASPSNRTENGRELLAKDPTHRGSLGIGMGEAMEFLRDRPTARLALGCMSYYAAMHQTVIGQELYDQLGQEGISPGSLLGCVGGGTNFVGFVANYAEELLRGRSGPHLLAVESANVPVLTKGTYTYEHADTFGFTPKVKMYTLGKEFVPPKIHAGGLRYHGKSPILSLLVAKGLVHAEAVSQEDAFGACKLFYELEGVLAAPETGHAIAAVSNEVARRRAAGEHPPIVFCLSGTGYLDLQGYQAYFELPR